MVLKVSIKGTIIDMHSCIDPQSFVWGLNNMLLQLEVREDIFSLGHMSQFIASQLAGLPEAKTRRKVGADRSSC